MILLLFISVIFKVTVTLGEVALSESAPEYVKNDAHKIFNHAHIAKPGTSYFIDKADNLLRLPDFTKNQKVDHVKKYKLKKPPKRTIQKIIKAQKRSKQDFYQFTNSPSTTEYVEKHEIQHHEEIKQTTQVVPKKKPKKWKGKMVRYPMPFQKLQPYKRDHRSRRNAPDDRNLYILQDLDEIKFVGHKNGNTAVKVHVKKYW